MVLLVSAAYHSVFSKKLVHFAYLAVALALAFQPDASQLTAFSIAAGIALFLNKPPLLYKVAILLGICACMLFAWSQPDPLEPVLHVEGLA